MQASIRIAAAPAKPVVIFDGDCTFCSVWIGKWRQLTGDRVEYLPFQGKEVRSRFPEIDKQQLAQAVHLVRTDGSVYYGAEAALRALDSNDGARWLLKSYAGSPSVAAFTETVYRFVADHRPFFSFLTRFFWGSRLDPSTYVLTRSIFIRSLGLIYLLAIISIWSQVEGLIGSRGILPAGQTMDALRHHADTEGIALDRYRLFPTFCWFNSSDRSLTVQCAAGTVLAVLVLLGIAPAPCLFLLWLIYLSLCTISREFLGFQWDNLLLEIGFLAMFFAPLGYLPWKTSTVRAPSTIIIWLLRWLLFRLMFESGCVKLLSRDETWNNLTALTFHYETQPLPTWVGWYAHQSPLWLHQACCFLMFGIELVLPFLIFTPRRFRHWTGVILIAFQAAIFLTGNYCFFNLLTIALCFLLFDDGAFRSAVPSKVRSLFRKAAGSASQPPGAPNANPGRRPLRFVPVSLRLCLAVLVLFLTIPQLLDMFRERSGGAVRPSKVAEWFDPFRTFNSYGLFAVMTRPRYEIIVQGSNDGETWLDYEFKYKPGDPRRRPGFVAPRQPRLDWQMWFAALGRYQDNPWFVHFCGRLLQGSPDVLPLLKTNPFPKAPPRYIRAMLYEYHFTDRATRRVSGEWWRRELKGEYLPVISLREK